MATKTIQFNANDIDVNRRFIYELYQQNQGGAKIFELTGQPAPMQRFKPYEDIPDTSSIVWQGGKVRPTDKAERPPGRYIIRYYDGCDSIFVDEQPKEKAILDGYRANTKTIFLQNGYLDVMGWDTMKKWYLDWCSYNSESPYRLPAVRIIFRPVDEALATEKKAASLDKVFEAMTLAKNAKDDQVKIHAAFLGVSFIDSMAQTPRELKHIKTDYLEKAKENPELFINSYSDKIMKVKYWITEALNSGAISHTKVPNKLSWGQSGSVICDCTGLITMDSLKDRLIEFHESELGDEFKVQLKALYK